MSLNRFALIAAVVLCSATASAQSLMRTQEGPTRQVQTSGATSGTVGTFTAALPDGGMTRQGCSITNISSGTLYAFLKSPASPTATVGNSVPIAAGSTWQCPRGSNNELDVASTAATSAYVMIVW